MNIEVYRKSAKDLILTHDSGLIMEITEDSAGTVTARIHRQPGIYQATQFDLNKQGIHEEAGIPLEATAEAFGVYIAEEALKLVFPTLKRVQ